MCHARTPHELRSRRASKRREKPTAFDLRISLPEPEEEKEEVRLEPLRPISIGEVERLFQRLVDFTVNKIFFDAGLSDTSIDPSGGLVSPETDVDPEILELFAEFDDEGFDPGILEIINENGTPEARA